MRAGGAARVLHMEPSDVDRIPRSFFVGSDDRVRDLSGYGVLLILAAPVSDQTAAPRAGRG